MIGLFIAVIIFTSILVILRLASKLFIKKQLAAEAPLAFSVAMKQVLDDFGEYARESRCDNTETRVAQTAAQ